MTAETENPLSAANLPPSPIKKVWVCDTQPLTVEGVKALLSEHSELRFAESANSLSRAFDVLREHPEDILIVDKAFGIDAICERLTELRANENPAPDIVVWGAIVSGAETLRLLEAGARGVLRKTAVGSTVLACLQTVARGRPWMDDGMFRPAGGGNFRNPLTARERQVLELVRQGHTNKEIGEELAIRPGTVKLHLKNVLQKTGVTRYSLAVAGISDCGTGPVPKLRYHSLHAA